MTLPSLLVHTAPASAVPLTVVTRASLKKWKAKQSAATRAWLDEASFTGKVGSHALLPRKNGKLARVIVVVNDPVQMWDIAALPRALPAKIYTLDGAASPQDEAKLGLGWLLGAYRFALHKKGEPVKAKLCLSKKVSIAAVYEMAATIAHTRDLITTPAEDMGPAELAEAVLTVAQKHGAKVTQIIGEDLLKKNYPAIYAVGRASPRKARLIDLTWGNPKHPKVTLVGKGVCFDTGGLDLKNASGMMLMRKDMGGAAVALGIASLVMQHKLPIHLRLLIPAAENVIGGDAFRPSDVIKMRSGLTVEVGNTDAEGRLVLADALYEAATEKPMLLIDFATLTGAARAALGLDISALFTDNDVLATDLLEQAKLTEDPMWRMPLYKPYASMLDCKFADITSSANSPYAGAITAALFLQRFVGKKQSWAHFDLGAWNTSSKAGRPEGGEAMALRAVYSLLEKRFTTA